VKARSLTTRLSVLVAVTTVAVGAVAGTWSYLRMLQEARDLQDDVLAQVASIASATAGRGAVPVDEIPLSNTSSDIDVTSLAKAGLPAATPGGFGTGRIGGESRRYFVIRGVTGAELVVSQSIEVRDQTARAAAMATLTPLLVLLPALTVAIYLVVRSVMRPVNGLARQVHARESTDLSPMDVAQAPEELRYFLAALNAQFERVGDALDRERLFIAKAAHELRTPLTAMSLQLERAAIAPDDASLRQRLADLSLGVERSRHLVAQMLDLAQAQAGAVDASPPQSLATIVRQVVGDLVLVADDAGVEIEVDLDGAGGALLPSTATTSILQNLLDNAIRYTPSGGHVHVSAEVSPGELAINVDDDGPGIASPADVLLPFHREAGQESQGSGLGLAVAVEQARLIRGRLALLPATRFAHGTRARLALAFDPIAEPGPPAVGAR
jgi:two-component system OmpR family sensor kinase